MERSNVRSTLSTSPSFAHYIERESTQQRPSVRDLSGIVESLTFETNTINPERIYSSGTPPPGTFHVGSPPKTTRYQTRGIAGLLFGTEFGVK
jgi:hypothetical protein